MKKQLTQVAAVAALASALFACNADLNPSENAIQQSSARISGHLEGSFSAVVGFMVFSFLVFVFL